MIWGQIRWCKWKQAFISFHWFDGWSQFWTVCFSISWSDPPTSSSHASISSRYDILIISLLFQLIKLINLSYLFSLFSLFRTYTVPFWVITRVSAFLWDSIILVRMGYRTENRTRWKLTKWIWVKIILELIIHFMFRYKNKLNFSKRIKVLKFIKLVFY